MALSAGIMVQWYAVQTKSHDEARVIDHLAHRAIPTFFPLVEVTRRYRRRRVTRLEALFPGYLFARLAPLSEHSNQWHSLQWAPGVKRVLGTDGVPAPVPDAVVVAIQARTAPLGFLRPGLGFGPDTRLVLRHGPFAGLEAIFDREVSRSGRVQVLMQLLGQTRRVQVDAVDLELV